MAPARVVCSAFLVSILVSAASARAELSFSQLYRPIPASDLVRDVEIADLDRDGWPDLVWASYFSDQVTVAYGAAGLPFDRRGVHAVPAGPHRVGTADLNRDAWPDVFLTCDHRVAVLLNDGAGGLGPASSFGVSSCWDVAAGDFNNDDKVDLVVGQDELNSVSVHLGDGNGSFAAGLRSSTSGRARHLAVAHLNWGSNRDVAVIGGFNHVQVLLGYGDGRFAPAQTYPAGTSPTGLAAFRLNGDAVMDLVVANEGSNDLSILYGIGDGSYQSQVRVPTSRIPQELAFGDANGDGVVDLFATTRANDHVSVLIGAGGGTYDPFLEYATGDRPLAIAVADLDLDGAVDIATANQSGSSIGFLKGHGNGKFGEGWPVSMEGLSNRAVVADLDGDGRDDLVGHGYSPERLTVRLGQGNGAFAPALHLSLDSGSSDHAVADLDEDGILDLVSANYHSISVFRGIGGGGFAPRVDYPNLVVPSQLVVSDVNVDGAPDVVVANRSIEECDCGCYTPSSVWVFLNDGNGTLVPGDSVDTGYLASSIMVADLNGDSRPDLLAGGPATPACDCTRGCNCNCIRGGNLMLFEGIGDGTFAPLRVVGVAGNPMLLADFDGDGMHDLASMSGTQQALTVSRGRGDGTFHPGTAFATGLTSPAISNVKTLTAADLDRDGRVDLAYPNPQNGEFAVLRGTGTGSFEARRSFITATTSYALALGDLDDDGWTDVVTGNGLGNLWVAFNRSSETVDVAVSLALVDAQPGRVRLSWSVALGAPTEIRVERRTDAEAWSDLGAATRTNVRAIDFEDVAAPAGRVAYRLRWLDPETGRAAWSPEVWVAVPSEVALALAVRNPTHASHAARLTASLPAAAPAILELIDIAGRRVWSRELAPAGAGPLEISIPAHAAAAGLHIVRLRQGDRVVARKIAFLP